MTINLVIDVIYVSFQPRCVRQLCSNVTGHNTHALTVINYQSLTI